MNVDPIEDTDYRTKLNARARVAELLLDAERDKARQAHMILDDIGVPYIVMDNTLTLENLLARLLYLKYRLGDTLSEAKTNTD